MNFYGVEINLQRTVCLECLSISIISNTVHSADVRAVLFLLIERRVKRVIPLSILLDTGELI
jgi:hypothetical protein